MISETASKNQAARLVGLDFFPKEAPARRELMLAIQIADTEEIAAGVITDWLEESRECPKPSDMRRLIGDRNRAVGITRRDCSICQGAGQLVRHYLVTYEGNSFRIQSAEKLPLMLEEHVQEFREKLNSAPGPQQDILSAAKACECRRAMA